MESDTIVYKGPPLEVTLPEISVGEFVYSRLRGLPHEHITHVSVTNSCYLSCCYFCFINGIRSNFKYVCQFLL